MPTIDAIATIVTQINHIKVEAKHQDALIRAMIEQRENNIAGQPGFISSTIHRSEDGKNVINYVQWTTKELLDAAHERPEFQRMQETYKHYVIDARPLIYSIVPFCPSPAK